MARGRKAKRRDDLLDHPRLKSHQVKPFREELYQQQGFVCKMCGKPAEEGKLDLDHDHSLGNVRAALCHRCNWFLGKIENNLKRLKLPYQTVIDYLQQDYSHLPFHPDHRTEEEKRLSSNERAKERRVKKTKLGE